MAKKTVEIKIEGYPQQKRLIESTATEIAFVAGIGAGKTHAGTQKMLDCLLKNPGASAIVTCPSYRILDIAVMPKYEMLFPNELVKKKRTRPYPEWELITGGTIYFYSTDRPDSIVGGEVAFVHMDEAALSPHLAYQNCKKRMRQRREDGTPYPYQIWVTTTPRQMNWVYLEFAAEEREDHELIVASTFDNIYRDEVEIKEYVDKLGLSDVAYKQEIEGSFEILAGDAMFSKAVLDEQIKNCIEPLEVRNHGAIQIYDVPVFGVNYIAAADTADEGGGGANCMIVQDPQTGKEMAEVYTEGSIDSFAEMCYEVLQEYKNPLFAPERNGTAGGILIEKFISIGYPNMFVDHKDRPGWYTVAGTALPPAVGRFTMLSEYEEAVRTRQVVIRSSDAIGEMSTFIRNSKGKFEHMQGCRDDRIMARAICWQLRKRARVRGVGFASFKRTVGTY
jgi:hypothetical protein